MNYYNVASLVLLREVKDIVYFAHYSIEINLLYM